MDLGSRVTDARRLRVVIKQLHEMCQLEQAEERAVRALELVDRMEDRIEALNAANARLLAERQAGQMVLGLDLRVCDGANSIPVDPMLEEGEA